MRYAILAITAAAAVSVAACGSSGNSTPAASKSSGSATTSSSPTPAPQSGEKDHVAGLIASVSGTTVQVNQKSGTATVDVTQSTKVAEMTPAQVTDLTPGACVSTRTPKDNASAAVRMVVIGTDANGNCAAPQNARPGMVRGTVASVNGNTVVLNVSQNGSTSQSNITVDNQTRYEKRAASTAQAIAQGKCLSASGTTDSSGALQAANVTLSPANNGKCGGGKR